MSSTDAPAIVHVAIELSTSLWVIAARFPGRDKCKLSRIEAGNTEALLLLMNDLRNRVAAGRTAALVVCFEAGRDGFWLHRWLTGHGIVAYVVEPTSILVNRRARRAKTDRLDAEGLLRVLAAWLTGDKGVCSMVRVPTPAEEDAKRPHRSASTWCRSGPGSRTAFWRFWRRRASGRGHRCGTGRPLFPRYALAMVVHCLHT